MFRYLMYMATLLVLQIVTWAITPILPLFRVRRIGPCYNGRLLLDSPRLPLWLSWFDTPDNSLLGDAKWSSTHDGDYWSMVGWLYRNSLYGFRCTVLACRILQPASIDYQGDPRVNRNNGITGLFRARMNGGYWQWKLVIPLVSDMGIMWNFGWQLDEFVKSGLPGVAMFQFSPRFVKIR